MTSVSWLLLLYSLPTTRSSERVTLWRKLKKLGAAQVKTSTYLLPDRPAQYEHFQWLSKQVRDAGGEATLVRAQEIEGLTDEMIVDLFAKAREEDYATLSRSIQELRQKRKGPDVDSFPETLAKLVHRFREIREIDFFDSSRSREIEALLQQLEQSGRIKGSRAPRLSPKHYQGKTWLTRPRPGIDRVSSAWLIRKFIDPSATFIFSNEIPKTKEIIPFDMMDVEFSHHGEDCTFETLVKRFDIRDKAVRRIAEMVHDADLEDGKFHRHECVGIHQILKGWAKLGLSDDQILVKGSEAFDALYAITKP